MIMFENAKYKWDFKYNWTDSYVKVSDNIVREIMQDDYNELKR